MVFTRKCLSWIWGFKRKKRQLFNCSIPFQHLSTCIHLKILLMTHTYFKKIYRTLKISLCTDYEHVRQTPTLNFSEYGRPQSALSNCPLCAPSVRTHNLCLQGTRLIYFAPFLLSLDSHICELRRIYCHQAFSLPHICNALPIQSSGAMRSFLSLYSARKGLPLV